MKSITSSLKNNTLTVLAMLALVTGAGCTSIHSGMVTDFENTQIKKYGSRKGTAIGAGGGAVAGYFLAGDTSGEKKAYSAVGGALLGGVIGNATDQKNTYLVNGRIYKIMLEGANKEVRYKCENQEGLFRVGQNVKVTRLLGATIDVKPGATLSTSDRYHAPY